MKAAVISLGSKSSQMIAEEMKKYFAQVDELNLKFIEVNLGGDGGEVLYQGLPLNNYDCILLRGSFRYVQLLKSMANSIENMTYTPLKSTAFTIGHDKLLTHLALQQHNVPMPKTYISSTPAAGKNVAEKMNYPIIMKFPQGSLGKGVMFADSFAAASSMLDALSTLNQPFIIQEYVETGGSDLRVIVAGDEVIASMKRIAAEGEKRANFHRGGKCEPVTLDFATKKLAIKTAKIIGAEICAVDILVGAKGPVVIEVNLSPGLQGITGATGINVADRMAKFLFKKAQGYKSASMQTGTDKLFVDLGIEGAEISRETGQVVKKERDIITNLDFRGSRILMPEIISQISDFSPNDEVTITAKKGRIILEKSSNGSED